MNIKRKAIIKSDGDTHRIFVPFHGKAAMALLQFMAYHSAEYRMYNTCTVLERKNNGTSYIAYLETGIYHYMGHVFTAKTEIHILRECKRYINEIID